MIDALELPTLPHLLRAGLRVVFIGYNPGRESARRGHYYAFHGNVFWRQLNASGLVAREVGFEDDERLMDEAGIGFTDLCPRATVRAAQLARDELFTGAHALLRELEVHQPRYAVFSGKGIYDVFGRAALGLSRREIAVQGFGAQPQRIGATIPWVIPSSSGLASKWHRQRLDLLRLLAAELAPREVCKPV